MAYVPGFSNDLFISYAHGDNEGRWISSFHERLRIKLRELLPVSPVIWRDERELGGENNFDDEILRQIGSTAVVLLVVSPAYLASRYCRMERQAFSRAAATRGGLNVGTSFRIIKAVKTPKENNEHRLFLKEALGFEFFRTSGDRDFDEFIPGDREFETETDRLARRMRDLLREMRNQRQAVFVAEAPPELESVWESVRNELSANGYRVVPTDRLDQFFAEEALLAELRPAIVSVHLFGSEFDEFSALQARLAHDLEKPAVIWVSPDHPLEPRQREFLETHAGYSDGRIRYAFLSKCRDWQLTKAILDELKPKREPTDTSLGSTGASIYLICDRTDPVEADVCLRLRDSLLKREKMQVVLPGTNKDPALLDEHHWNCLASCDGVLLYWGYGGKEWFLENSVDVNRASRRLRSARPFRSEAIVLGEPEHPDKAKVEGRLVIRAFDESRLDRLEPFLAPLRNELTLNAGGGGQCEPLPP